MIHLDTNYLIGLLVKGAPLEEEVVFISGKNLKPRTTPNTRKSRAKRNLTAKNTEIAKSRLFLSAIFVLPVVKPFLSLRFRVVRLFRGSLVFCLPPFS